PGGNQEWSVVAQYGPVDERLPDRLLAGGERRWVRRPIADQIGRGIIGRLPDNGIALRRDPIDGRRGKPRQRHYCRPHLSFLGVPFFGDRYRQRLVGHDEVPFPRCLDWFAVEGDAVTARPLHWLGLPIEPLHVGKSSSANGSSTSP